MCARVPADVDEVILVDNHSVDDTLEVTPEYARVQPGGKQTALRVWTPGEDETASLDFRVPSAVSWTETT